MSHSVDYSTLTTPSSTLISGADLTPEQKLHASMVVGDYARALRKREGLTGEQCFEAADEILQMLGLIPTVPLPS
jgi:hypothetical protein